MKIIKTHFFKDQYLHKDWEKNRAEPSVVIWLVFAALASDTSESSASILALDEEYDDPQSPWGERSFLESVQTRSENESIRYVGTI